MLRTLPEKAGGVENHEDGKKPSKGFRWNLIEQIMGHDHDDAESGDQRQRQIDEGCERDHRPSQGPDHDQQSEVEIEVELPGEAAQNDDFQEDKPETTGQQKESEF